MPLDPAHQMRLAPLYQWRSLFAASNTAVQPNPAYSMEDMDFADGIAGAFALALGEVYESAPALAEWDAAYSAMVGDMSVLMALGGAEPYSRTENQVHTYHVWLNPVSGKRFVCLVDGRSSGGGTGITPHADGWVDPASPAWDDSGAPFTMTITLHYSDGSVMEEADITYVCIGDAADLPRTSGATDRVQLLRRYTARMDYCRTLAGIVPKSDSSTTDAGGCWIDHEDPFWWVDTDGYYLPAFTNKPYISSRRDADGKPYSTREFGFGLAVACENHLKIGDSITLRIESVDSERPYRVGDEAVLQTIGAGAAWLAGGIDGTDVQTWRVLGSSAGLLPDYIVPTDGTAAPVYAQAGVALRLALGGIPFQLGDAFTFSVEAGQFRWRRDGGAWSALADIPPGGQAALADGLEVVFESGAAPSFVPGDAYAFAVHQPWAASNLQDAQATAWGWDGSDATMTIDLGAVQQIGAIALARYQLPEGAAVAAEVSQDGMAWSAPLALDVTRPVSVAVFHLFMAARFVRFSVISAPGGSIGWVWCGQPLATENHASTCERLRRWASTRGNGLNAAALYAGAGNGWKLAWENALLEPDVAALLGLGDWAQEHDEPLLFVPHHLHPADASLVRWGADALQVGDIHAYQPDNEAWRLMSGALDLEPVFA